MSAAAIASETITDIIAEKRNRADEIERDVAEKMKRGEIISDQYAREVVADLRKEAARLDAAKKREIVSRHSIEIPIKIVPICNMAAMYEALKTLRQRFNNNVMAYQDRYLKFSGWHWHKKAAEAAKWRDVFYELREACDAALAKPPRNCDIYTTEDAVDTATVTVRDECGVCPSIDMEAPCVFCMVRWLLAPAKKGGAK